MLVSRFKIRRTESRRGLGWFAESDRMMDGEFKYGFAACAKSLSDAKAFAALVRYCGRVGKIEQLSEKHPEDYRDRWQSTWGGSMYPNLKD